MEKRYQRIGFLILKSKNEGLDAAEAEELQEFLGFSMENRKWYESIDEDDPVWKEKLLLFAKIETEQPLAWENLQDIRTKERIKVRHIAFWRVAAAASITITLTVGFGYLFHQNARTNIANPNITNTKNRQDISPGSNTAVLTLASGTTILLSQASKGILAKQGSFNIVKLADGKISYNANNDAEGKSTLNNTISTPRGGQYQLILPDGSKVWINSASSLTYPTAFTGKDRRVELSGEAYFEVAKDKTKPFFVAIGNSRIQVLGTHFNINGYADDGVIKTTLLEGSVKVTLEESNVTITPGQQAQINTAKKLSDLDNQPKIRVLENVNTKGAVAWKNGHFHFESASIQTVMRELSRWYDFEVSYDGPIPTDKFSGDIQRDLMFSEMIRILGANINYSIEGKKIIVKPSVNN